MGLLFWARMQGVGTFSLVALLVALLAGCEPQPDSPARSSQLPPAPQQSFSPARDTTGDSNASSAADAVDPPVIQQRSPADSAAEAVEETSAVSGTTPDAQPQSEISAVDLAGGVEQTTSADEPPAGDIAQTPANKQRPKLDWKNPRVVFVLSGRQHGYIEPCGCQTLAEQKGGLSRRHTFLRELTDERGWNVVPLDLGDQVKRFGRQSEIKFAFTIDGLKKMNYRAVAFGPDDLRLSIDQLALVSAQTSDENTPFVSANIAVLDRELTPRYKVIEAGGLKIGITSILGDKAVAKLNVDEVVSEPAAEALSTTWSLMKSEQCDYHVLLSHASRDESTKLAQAVPHFEFVITADGGELPASKPSAIRGTKSQLIEIGPKGMYIGVLGLFDDRRKPWEYELVALNAAFEDSREMLDLLAQYQQELELLGLEGLSVRPLNHPSGRKFVGSEKCGECHTKAYAVYEKTPHHHATETLVHPSERSEIPRHFDPECLSCHVTGWNPQRFVPFESGYLSLEQTPQMLGNGCENCHGPGSAHVAAESGDTTVDEAGLKLLRDEMRLPFAEAEKKCIECHDLDNSPGFHPNHFQEYWEKIVHTGKD